jgi:hypothetical protein
LKLGQSYKAFKPFESQALSEIIFVLAEYEDTASERIHGFIGCGK